MDKAEEQKIIAEKLTESLNKHRESLERSLLDAEPLPDLNVPIKDIVGLLHVIQSEMDGRDFSMILLILSMMYGIDDELEFMKRLAKTTLVIEPDIEVTSKP
jgi:hypothetical protein